MNETLTRLAERKRRLIDDAALQRTMVSEEIDQWRPIVTRVDQGLTVAYYLKKHPLWLIGGGVVAASIGPGRIWKWLGRGVLAWRLEHLLRLWRL